MRFGWYMPLILVAALAPIPGQADFFGPSNYSACILKNLAPDASVSAARLVMNSCKSEFPDTEATDGVLGMLGPSDFDECIFEYAPDASESGVARLIQRSCRTLFPEQPAADSPRRNILLRAAEAAGGYVTSAMMVDQIGNTSCGRLIGVNDFPTIGQATRETLAEFPPSEQVKVKRGLEDMRANLPDPYGKWGGIDKYIEELSAEYGEPTACGILLGEVSALHKTAFKEWLEMRSLLRELD